MIKPTLHRNGTLQSPYGYMTVKSEVYPNGYAVENNRLIGVQNEHRVPDHWVRTTDVQAVEAAKGK